MISSKAKKGDQNQIFDQINETQHERSKREKKTAFEKGYV